VVNVVRWKRAGVVAGVSLIGACSTVLGFEDASLDPQWAADSGVPSGGAGGDGSGGDTSGGGGEGGGLVASCRTYCEEVAANCVLKNKQYTSIDTCMGVCAVLPPGSADDPSGNTLACRYDNALKAKMTGEPDVHCPRAGPGGEDTCGPNCSGYCAAMLAICPGYFDTYEECEEPCAELDDEPGFNVSPANQSGPTVDCRLYHVSAATIGQEEHCPHAAGEFPCILSDAGYVDPMNP
jgi:hypothetical protein